MNVLSRLSGGVNPNRLEAGLSIVRKVLSVKADGPGLTTTELYRLALQEKPPSTFRPSKPIPRSAQNKTILPPHPEHPIQSINFLKRTVLPLLEEKREFHKIRTARVVQAPTSHSTPGKTQRKGGADAVSSPSTSSTSTTHVWVWKPLSSDEINPKARQQAKKTPFGAAVGAGEDWSHLNKRRRRARVRKVADAVGRMKVREVNKVVQVHREVAAQRANKAQRRRDLRNADESATI